MHKSSSKSGVIGTPNAVTVIYRLLGLRMNMSTYGSYSPPPSPSTGAKAAAVIVSLVILAIIAIISCYCAKKKRKAIISYMQTAVGQAIIVAPPALNVVKVWEVDAPTMEKFLQELAREKPIVGRRRNARVRSTESLDWFPKQVWDEYEKGELAAMTVSCGIEDKDRARAERMSLVALWCVQDSPETRPPMSAVVKMLEGGVDVNPPPKPFRYLFSVGVEVLNPPNNTNTSSDYSTSEGNNSYWYKESTPIMTKYEI
ncbi:unnamed protein product [Ilex paraguariensis]|uniref:Uncharacterized protein n=1 Tax=Ilex paraguariensis TaxID=185542 RepID=A0ABC8T9D1_9AQUA